MENIEIMQSLQELNTKAMDAIVTNRDDIAKLGEQLKAERKEREHLESKFNRVGLSGGGFSNNSAGELKSEGEWLRKYIATGDKSNFMGLDEAKGMSVGSDPEGGYSVLPAFSPG
jgi:HK97 family phage major capsid protein